MTAEASTECTWELKRYSLPSIDHSGWAEIIICSSGMFAAVSDYGNWAFAWRHTGHKDFRTFLIECSKDPHYVAGKLFMGRQQEYAGEETFRGIRHHLCEQVKHGSISKEFAKTEIALLMERRGDIEDDGVVGFSRWYEETQLDDAYEWAVYRYPIDLMSFVKRTIPRLSEILKAELAEDLP